MTIDDTMSITRRERVQQMIKSVLTKFNADCSDSTQYPDITDSDDAKIIYPTIGRLKT